MENSLLRYIHYIPILTTFISALFAISILTRFTTKKGAFYLLWWGIGVAVYGLGTLVESYHTLMGWSELNFKLWYIFGALLGGAPLAIGSIYLLLGKKVGHASVIILTVTVSILSLFVFLSPIKTELIDPNVLNSNVLGWQDIRKVSPFINGLAAIFLIGGAIYSALNYRKKPEMRNRYIGNIYIAIGAILPGIGGGFSRAGFTEALYIGEFIGILLIWYGYVYCRREGVVADVVLET
ncbi:MAG: hypothetical protein DWP97_09985 [Calditrichaeota bacterium]|nr:MAG: hypothetical protein DWP97_09985 [Calditrichota bacterium]